MALKIKPKKVDRTNRLDYTNPIAELILRRRQQILVHSYLYYQRNTNLVSDAVFDKWAYELVDLQAKYPEIAKQVKWHDAFVDFDGTTGFNLPFWEMSIRHVGDYLLCLEHEAQSRQTSRRFGEVKNDDQR
jgi:hypothetical protein